MKYSEVYSLGQTATQSTVRAAAVRTQPGLSRAALAWLVSRFRLDHTWYIEDKGKRCGARAAARRGGAGVKGEANQGDGVVGYSSAALKSGAYGWRDQPANFGVYARNATRTALGATGKVSLSRFGVAVVPKGKTHILITVPGGVIVTSKFLVTMQGSPGGGALIAYATKYGTDKIKLRFNEKTTNKSSAAWMVLD
jgi:hypothetical protein